MSATTLAITMGDPAGVGPEIIVKAAATLAPRLASGELRLLILGSRAALDAACTLCSAPAIPTADEAGDWPALSLLPVSADSTPIRWGEISAAAGRFAYLAIERAVRLAEAGRVAALVTAPLNKEALNLAGYHYAGHTELLAALTGASGSVMLLAHGAMRVSHVCTHVARADVPRRLTPERLTRVVELPDGALRRMGIAAPHIAVAALNPHAGEGGLFGREDIEISVPTIAACVARGFHVSGPVPGDTVFVKLRAGQFDAVVAMYHDQGHIPVKLLGFSVDPATGRWEALSGVNITLGLPIIRTSVDHGTAFDIAGRGIADAMSLVEAIDAALLLGRARA